MTASPFLGLPGAVEADDVDKGVPAHYGDPMREQRALDTGAVAVASAHRAIVDLSHRSVLTITGPDRLTWVDSLTSQSVARLAPGESSETLLLDPSGHIEYAVRLLDDGETLWMLLERHEAPGLLAWLTSMRFMLRVELADRTDDFATIGTTADPAALELPVASPAGVPLIWVDPWHEVTPGGHQYARGEHPGSGWSWSESLIPRGALAAVADRAATGELTPVGTLAVEALRIAAWRPRFATEADDRSIPHELDWLRTAVHLSKGCYRGQETVAKVHNLGHPPRRLVMLHLDGSDAVLPPAGAPLHVATDADRQSVGTVTSSARHWELGPIALAVVKRSTAGDAVLVADVDGVAVTAAQETVVPPDAGAAANVPRLPRLGAVTR